MINIKNSQQLAAMREAGKITGEALLVAREHLRDGVSTAEVDAAVRRYIEKCGARPSFLGYAGFTGSACISINDEVIHGIPSPRRYIHDGDIVKVDVGAYYKGFHGDSAKTFPVGHVSEEALRLIEATKGSFYEAVRYAVAGMRIGDIGSAVEAHVTKYGYTVVREYEGHGVGSALHEDPGVPNFGRAGHGPRLCNGMTIAIEPMVNAGTADIRVLKDGWTVVTADGRLSAHYEHTVAVTPDGPVLLTDVGE